MIYKNYFEQTNSSFDRIRRTIRRHYVFFNKKGKEKNDIKYKRMFFPADREIGPEFALSD